MFKDLVQSILKYDRDKSVITMKVIDTLKRDIRNDITNAFDLALPLIRNHRDLYSRSSSFTAFLFKMCRINLGADDDEQDRHIDAERSRLERLGTATDADSKCEEKLSTANAELKTVSQETERLKAKLSELQNQVDRFKRDEELQSAKLHTLSGENEKMKTRLSEYEERVEQYKRSSGTKKSDIECQTEELQSHVDQFKKDGGLQSALQLHTASGNDEKMRFEHDECETERQSSGTKKLDFGCQTTPVCDGTLKQQRVECDSNGIASADVWRSLETILSQCIDICGNASSSHHLRETAPPLTTKCEAEGMKTERNPPFSTFVERFETFRNELQETIHGLEQKATVADKMLRALRVPDHAPPDAIPKKLELLRQRVPEKFWFNPTESDVPGAKFLSLALLKTRLGTFDLAKKIDDDPKSETYRLMLTNHINCKNYAGDFDLNAVIEDNNPELEKTRKQLVSTLTAAHDLDMAFYDPTEVIEDTDLDDTRREILDNLDLRSMVGVSELGVKGERSGHRISDEEIAKLQNEVSDLKKRIEQQNTAADLELENSRRVHQSAMQAAVEKAKGLREEIGLTKSNLQSETEKLKKCLKKTSSVENENSKMTTEIASLRTTNANAVDESHRRSAAETRIGEKMEKITRAFTDICTTAASVSERRPDDAAQCRSKRESSPDAGTLLPSLDALVDSLDAVRERTQSVVHELDKKATVANDMLRALRVPEDAPLNAVPKKLELLRERVPETLWFNATDYTVHGAEEMSRGIMTARLKTFDLAKKIDDDPKSETYRLMFKNYVDLVDCKNFARHFDLTAVIEDNPELEKTRKQLVSTLTAAHNLDMAFYDLTKVIGDENINECRKEILGNPAFRSAVVGVSGLGVKDERSEPRMSDEEITELLYEVSDLKRKIEEQNTAAVLELENSRLEHDKAMQDAVEKAKALREEVGKTKSNLQSETEKLKKCLEKVISVENENSEMTTEIARLKTKNANALYESNRCTAAEKHIRTKLEKITRAFTDIYTDSSVSERPDGAEQDRSKRESSSDAGTLLPSLDALVDSLDAARERTQSVVHELDKKARAADEMRSALRVPEDAPLHAIPKKLPEALWFNATEFTVRDAEKLSHEIRKSRLRSFDLGKTIDDAEAETLRKKFLRELNGESEKCIPHFNLDETISEPKLEKCRSELVSRLRDLHTVHMAFYDPTQAIEDSVPDECRKEAVLVIDDSDSVSKREHKRFRDEMTELRESDADMETDAKPTATTLRPIHYAPQTSNDMREKIAGLERKIESLILDHNKKVKKLRRVSDRNLEDLADAHAIEIENMKGRFNDLLGEKTRLETKFEIEIKELKKQNGYLMKYSDLNNTRFAEDIRKQKECVEKIRILEEEKRKMKDEVRAEIESSEKKYSKTLVEARAETENANALAKSKLEDILWAFENIYRETSVSDLVEPDPKREGESMEVEGRSALDALMARLVGVREKLQSLVHDLNKKATVADEIRRALRVPEHAPLDAIPNTLRLLRRRVPEERWFDATDFTVQGAEELSTGLLNAKLRSFDLDRSIDADPDTEGFRNMLVDNYPLKTEAGAFSSFDLTEEIPNSHSDDIRRQLVSRLTVLHDLHMTFYDLTEEIEDNRLNGIRKEILRRSGGFNPEPNRKKFEILKLEHAAAMKIATEQTEEFRRAFGSANKSLEECFERMKSAEEEKTRKVEEAARRIESSEVEHAKSLNEALENVKRLEEKEARVPHRRSRTTTKDREMNVEQKPKKKITIVPKKKTSFYNTNSKTKQQHQKYLKLLKYNKQLKADLEHAQKENKIFNSLAPLTAETFYEIMTVRSLKELLFQTLFNYYKIRFQLKTIEIYTVDLKKMQDIYTKLENLNRQFPEPQDGDTRETYFEILRSYAFEDARLMIETEPPDYNIHDTRGFLNDCIERIEKDIDVALNKINKENYTYKRKKTQKD